ncbi:MAG: hypothetical protein U9N61_00265 [Euryarchaeota archaeon]|nr:hypothetical protein [Euryarchaeota archaeon]
MNSIIRDIMLELEDPKDNNSISVVELTAHAEDKGIQRETVEELLEWLKRDGIIYSTSAGFVKFNR